MEMPYKCTLFNGNVAHLLEYFRNKRIPNVAFPKQTQIPNVVEVWPGEKRALNRERTEESKQGGNRDMTNEQLVIRIKAGIDPAENMLALYEQVKAFIHSIAWKHRGLGEVEDLEQEGYLALYDAIDGYDPDTGNKLPMQSIGSDSAL